MFDSVRGDVEGAIKSNCAYLAIHSLAAADRKIYDKYQRSAQFWVLIAYALQTTFFIAFGRIFDKRTDSFSIQKVVESTIANPVFFSRGALRERRRKSDNMYGPDPQWLIDYVNQAWEPTAADLEPLRTSLMPHYDKFTAIYRPIRHKFFAHRERKASKPSIVYSARPSRQTSPRSCDSYIQCCGLSMRWHGMPRHPTSPIS
jgi:hypothetical protein